MPLFNAESIALDRMPQVFTLRARKSSEDLFLSRRQLFSEGHIEIGFSEALKLRVFKAAQL